MKRLSRSGAKRLLQPYFEKIKDIFGDHLARKIYSSISVKIENCRELRVVGGVGEFESGKEVKHCFLSAQIWDGEVSNIYVGVWSPRGTEFTDLNVDVIE